MPITIENEVDLYDVLSDGNLINPSFVGAYKKLISDDVAVANDFYNIINNGDCPILPFRLSKLSLKSESGTKVNYTLCPDTSILLERPTDYGFFLLRNHTTVRARSIVAQKKILSFLEKFGSRAKSKRLKDPIFWAYYIPYHNERPQKDDKPEEILGYVDFHATDPVTPYVITGQMNGCHLIVSASPYKGYLRAWHYQSPGSKPVFTKYNFPFKVYAWITDADYAGTRLGVDVCGFNYLQFNRGKWWVVSQPQALGPRNTDTAWGSYIAAPSTKKMFVSELNHKPHKIKMD